MTKRAAAFDCLVLRHQSWRFCFSHKMEELKMTECVCPKRGVCRQTPTSARWGTNTVNHPPWSAQPIHPFPHRSLQLTESRLFWGRIRTPEQSQHGLLVYCGGADKRALSNRDLCLTPVEIKVAKKMSRLHLQDGNIDFMGSLFLLPAEKQLFLITLKHIWTGHAFETHVSLNHI